MSYENFRQQIIEKNGDFFSSAVTAFFEKAVELATNEKYEEALAVGNDALVLVKYSNIGYPVVYLIGMLCQAYLDNDQPEVADRFFRYGMTILNENDATYDDDINQFLDLKGIIDDDLKQKSGA